jgi:hypothetical protein
MHVSRGFDSGRIHAIGVLVIYKYIILNTQLLSVFPKFNASGSISKSASDGASFPVLIMH